MASDITGLVRGYDFFLGGERTQVFMSGTGTITIVGTKIAKASVSFSASSSVTFSNPTVIAQAQVTFNGVGTFYPIAAALVTAQVAFAGTSSFSARAPIRFAPGVIEDLTNLRPLFILNGKPLTEHNRTMDSAVIQSYKENVNWKTQRRRYYQRSGGRKSFSISWTSVPGKKSQTVDTNYGRDYIKEMAEDGDVHTLEVLNFDTNGTTPYTSSTYNVVTKSYNETLLRRDLPNDMYLWNCTIEFEEV